MISENFREENHRNFRKGNQHSRGEELMNELTKTGLQSGLWMSDVQRPNHWSTTTETGLEYGNRREIQLNYEC